MLCSVSFSGCLSRVPSALRRFDLVVVCSKKKPPNNGYPGRGRRPRKKYSRNSEDEIDISLLYDANSVIEIPRGFVVDCNKRINQCIEESNLQEAQEIFDLMVMRSLDPDVVTYNTLMKGYSRSGDNKKVFELFNDMEKNRLRPDDTSFNTVINACAIVADLDKALYLLDRMMNRYWITPSVITYSSVLNVCAGAKKLEIAKNILEEMHSSDTRYDVITLTTMIDVYAECCNKDNARLYLKECRDLLEEMDSEGVKANVRTVNTLLKLCARGSLTTEAMDLLDEMTIKKMRPNAFTYSTVIDGISKDERLSNDEVKLLSERIIGRMKQEDILLNAHTYNNLVNIALRMEDLNGAVGLFDEMKKKRLKFDAVTYGAMIKCYEKLGDLSTGDVYLKPCLDLLAECEQSGIVMDLEGYTSMLTACANVANLETASNIWSKMIETKIKPNVFAFTAMISVCLSANGTTKAFELLNEMKTSRVEPNEVTYKTFIAHFMKKKDTSGAQRAYIEMNSLGVKPDKDTLNMLKALRVG